MAGYILLGTLAAFGMLSVLWAALGWLLPGEKGGAMVCVGCPGEGLLSRYRWMRSLGLIRIPLLIVTDDAAAVQLYITGVEICRPEELISRLELERDKIDGTGNGDSAGHHQCGGVPKL